MAMKSFTSVRIARDDLSETLTSPNVHGIKPQQLRLAIETRKGYKGAAKGKEAKKGATKPKGNSKSVRQKSVKARYVKKS